MSAHAEPIRTLEALLHKMWDDYIDLNPQARRIHELFVSKGEQIFNDHIALRTFSLPKVAIDVVAKPFLDSGYVLKGDYQFPKKKLYARHFEHPCSDLPKLFISQLLIDQIAKPARDVISSLVDQIDPPLPTQFHFSSIGRPWKVTWEQYETLRSASDYAAWVAAFGFSPNHFTVDVGRLTKYATIEQVNALLEDSGFVLNDVGGKIKGSPAELLEQSSVMANNISVDFDDGAHTVPGCYYEFARRYPGPDGRLYQGFIAASADRIFESTSRSQ